MQQDTEFIARLRERNLMSLRAFVRIPDRFSLVYDYIPNSSLENTMNRHWDDGVFSTVMKVNVYTGNDERVVRAVKVKYMKRDGDSVWSLLHGYSGTVNEIKLDYPSEEIVGIEGYHGAVEGRDGSEAITCITFHTNMREYGPFREEVGTYFSSTLYGGKVVGFSGRSGSYLNAIGVHVEYF
ncbi:hypothetical protein LOK49_LG05G03639 [Camellia lanceoleosa]|uniref:Uncharacterized protein n=1 Tax=Camellia lanceoleosa TaxID=1840588 RepID=A0ACC0HM90_9ERIC|nr:hypothetical protein LOK49_LG05G03639 [Camellia lanceoleosa]